MANKPIPVIFDCDPGHDDAIALLLALASPELHLLGVITSYGNQTLAKTTVNALRLLQFAGRADIPLAVGAAQPLLRALEVAAHVHGESGLDGPALPRLTTHPASEDAVAFMAALIRSATQPVTLQRTAAPALRALC